MAGFRNGTQQLQFVEEPSPPSLMCLEEADSERGRFLAVELYGAERKVVSLSGVYRPLNLPGLRGGDGHLNP